MRKRLGLTQREFAERVGVTANHVAKWERGVVSVSRIAAILISLVNDLHPKEARDEGQGHLAEAAGQDGLGRRLDRPVCS